VWDETGAVSVLVVPECLWELFLGVYCAVWGFRRDSPILSGSRRSTPEPAGAGSRPAVMRIGLIGLGSDVPTRAGG